MIRKYKHENKTCYEVRISYTNSKGKRTQRRFKLYNGLRITSHRDAEIIRAETLMKLKAESEGNLSKQSFKKYHQEEFLPQVKLTLRANTYMQYECNLMKWMSDDIYLKNMEDITKSDIHDYIFNYTLNKGASPHVRKRLLKTLRRIFQTAMEDGIITRNPALGLKVKTPPPVQQVLNSEEATTLLSCAKAGNHPFYYLWAVALLTGMRNGELYSLRWSDIDLSTKIITVSSSWNNKDGLHSTKSNKNRVIPISKDLEEILINLKNIGPFEENLKGLVGSESLVTDLVLPRYKEWARGSQSSITKKYCKEIGIKEIKFHDLRATFITNLLGNNVPIPKVMSIVGHARMSTTNEYLRLAGVGVKGATESLGYSVPKYQEDNLISLFEQK